MTPAAAEVFSFTGRYKGVYACDSVQAGVPSGWGRPFTAGIVHNGSTIQIDLRYEDKLEGGPEYSLYRGTISSAPSGDLVVGYFEACGGTFPSRELARIFPAGTRGKPFRFAADSIWVSSQTPNVPGLIVQSCKWTLSRESTRKPAIRTCPEH